MLAGFGVELDALTGPEGAGRRPLMRFCLDWSEQRHHLAGRLGAALLAALLERDWVRRGARRRVLAVTEDGDRALRRLGLAIDHGPCAVPESRLH